MKLGPYILALSALVLFFSAPLAVREPKTEALNRDSGSVPVPVIVELFTSEGCSSCPPAESLLIHLQDRQPVEGVEILALEQHVDYWDRLGWKDPFSSPRFSRRQRAYAGAFGNHGVYTPQMVVDGQAEFVGSDRGKALEAIASAARRAKGKLEIELHTPSKDGLRVPAEIHIQSLPKNARLESPELIVAIVEDKLSTNVTRGENSGRRLPHAATVRDLRRVKQLTASGDKLLKVRHLIELDADWQRENLRIVAFVQDLGTRRIVAACQKEL